MTWTPPVHDPTRELREHLSEDEWRAAVSTIAARHGLAHASLTAFETGSDIVWAAGEQVIKLTAPKWRDELAAEARHLAFVHGRLSVRTPEPIATGELAGWPYVVMSRVPGVAIGSVWPRLERAERLRLASGLGQLTRELHALPLPEPDDWDAFWRTCRTDVPRRHARGTVPSELLEAIADFLAALGPLESDARALLHTELLDQHILVEERGGRFELAALIDFADGRVGPPEYEFPAPVEFIFRGESGLLRAFLQGYGEPLERHDPARRLGWALCHRFGSLARMLRAVHPARPSSLEELAQLLYAS